MKPLIIFDLKKTALSIGSILMVTTLIIAVFYVRKQKTIERRFFPKPTGRFAIETVKYHWTDRTLTEESPRKVGPRELIVQIWYPAEGVLPEKPLYNLSQNYIDMLVDEIGLNKSEEELEQHFLSYFEKSIEAQSKMSVKELRKVLAESAKERVENKKSLLRMLQKETKTYLSKEKEKVVRLKKLLSNGESLKSIGAYYAKKVDASKCKISSEIKKFPVIIFSHGFGMGREFYSAYCENLASHGYVVVSADHTYSAFQAVLPSGIGMASRAKEFVDDLSFILKQLEILNSSGSFKDRLDLNNIGMFGHSLGGAATIEMCRKNKRVKAGVSMDAPLFLNNFAKPLARPFMLLQSENSLESKEEFGKLPVKFCEGISKMGCDAYWVTLRGTGHNSFSDEAILKEIVKDMINNDDLVPYFAVGSADGYFMTKKINNYLLAFFNKYLRGVDSELLLGIDFMVCK